MTVSYDPAVHDVPLLLKWKEGLNDYEISDSFRKDGLVFTSLMVRAARRRMRLVPNGPKERPREVEGSLPGSKADPLAVAQTYLPGFDRDRLTLNGRAINLTDAMRRTNTVLKARGIEQVAHNPAWVVD